MTSNNIVDIDQRQLGKIHDKIDEKDQQNNRIFHQNSKYSVSLYISIIEKRPLIRKSIEHLFATHEPNWSVEGYNNEESFLSRRRIKNKKYPEIIILSLDRLSFETDLWDDVSRVIYRENNVVAFFDIENDEFCVKLLNMGVKGIITPFIEVGIILSAIKLVSVGGTYIPPFLIRNFNNKHEKEINYNYCDNSELKIRDKDRLLRNKFTQRQWEVLSLICEGLPNKTIAYKLNMKECSVKAHVRQLMQKMGANNRTHIVSMATEIISN